MGRASAVRRWDDGRECCYNNPAGRAEYQHRKQLLWGEQRGVCAHCGARMPLNETRLTHGDWEDKQKRDDRLRDENGSKVNFLVHKSCLRAWHSAVAV
jgi:hypothetical protein